MGYEYDTNGLGVTAHYGARNTSKLGEAPLTAGTRKELRIKLVGTSIPSAVSANTLFAPQASIPAGAYIESAKLIQTVDFTSGGAATLDIGLYYNNSGAVGTLDADGIDAAIALTALQTDDAVIACDGALVGTTLASTASSYVVGAIYGTAAYTAGEAELVITYVDPV